MKFIIFNLMLSLFIFINPVFAEEQKYIELKDGSNIFGEVVGFRNGAYTVKARSLGTIKIDDSKVVSIRAMDIPKMKANISKRDDKMTQVQPQQLKSMQNSLMRDDDLMTLIMSLQNDPDMKTILKDPAIMSAIESGDIQSLIRNPDFMKLMNNSVVKSIQKKSTR